MASLDDTAPRTLDPSRGPRLGAGRGLGLVDVRRRLADTRPPARLVLLVTGATFAITALANLPTRDLYVATTRNSIDPTRAGPCST